MPEAVGNRVHHEPDADDARTVHEPAPPRVYAPGFVKHLGHHRPERPEDREHGLDIAVARGGVPESVEDSVAQAVLEHLQDRVVLDDPGEHRRRADEPAQRRAIVVVQPVEEIRREAPLLEERGELRLGCRQELVDEALRQGLGRVHEDELLALLLVVVGDKPHDTDRESIYRGVADGGDPLLSVDHPPRPLLLRQARVDGYDERPRPRVVGLWGAEGGLEPDAAVGRDDDGIRDHRVLGLQVGADLGHVREHLRPLVALDGDVTPADAGDGGELAELLPIDREAVERPARALPDLERRQA
jgi:hypothetical protein